MSGSINYLLNRASEAAIVEHLWACDADFMPPLSSRVDIDGYSQKIASKALRFEAWAGEVLVGLIAAYGNDHATLTAYISNVSVLRDWKGKGIAAHLMTRCLTHIQQSGMRRVSLEVSRDNLPAIRLYEKSGFIADKSNDQFLSMVLYLNGREEHEQQA